MRALINDLLRSLISNGIAVLGFTLQHTQQFRLSTFRRSQRKLRRRFDITEHTPVMPFGYDLEKLITTAASKHGDQALFAFTSGSTGRPKRLLYTLKRVRFVKWVFIDVFARAVYALNLKRTSLYVFSSFSEDESLTTLLLDDRRLPNYFTTLQAPYRVQCDPAIRDLVATYGGAAVRLWLLVLANPGVVYCTNPSTLATFLGSLSQDWIRTRQLVKDWHERPLSFTPRVCKIARRIDSAGSKGRFALITVSRAPLSLEVCAPGFRSYICWTGGYVKPFLERVEQHLPASRYRLIPLYSMSTESIETVTCFQSSQISFLPSASGVLYEFLEETRTDEPVHVLGPGQLELGKNYTMIISDAFGLRRYQTDDVFRCCGYIHGLPDLSFLRRRGLEYSFTGEKLTADQLGPILEGLTRQYPSIFRDSFLTCVPYLPRVGLPHYRILVVGNDGSNLDNLAQQCDENICQVNAEYERKRLSGRLGPAELLRLTTAEFIDRIANGRASWETQFKVLPLYRELWRD